MKKCIMQITGMKKPRTAVRVHWLGDMGFTYGAPVYAAPQTEGFTLALQHQHVAHENGKFIHTGRHKHGLSLVLYFTQTFTFPGRSVGDFLVAECEHGFIKARKLPPAQRYCILDSHPYDASLCFSGKWLMDIGFFPGTVIIVSVDKGSITFSVWDDITATCANIVKFARARKCQIMQPMSNRHIPILDIPDYVMSRAGFRNGDICGVLYEHGLITLFKPEYGID